MASKISILDQLVANQIAAGEVIERPASVVKELVENSIDAKSNRIQLEIEDGGRKAIRILDNGEGILKSDVLLAFERHATSKIKEVSDLFSIRTLGFRGEALPSIASVSKVTLKTRNIDEDTGTLVKIVGGEVIEQREVGMAVGTDFLVEDLFFNTPARLKYLKTISTELGQISDIFNRIALARPEIAMTLSHNGKLVSKTPGTGRLIDTILSIYGKELTDNLIEVNHEESYVRISGFITTPAIFRASKKHQSFFVNGRFIKSSLLSRSVDDGYKNLLPHGKYPVVFLFIKVNPLHVDVNVHPAKFEVKFSRPEIVMEAVSKGIKKALLNLNYLPTFSPIKKVIDKGSDFKVEQSLFKSITNTEKENTPGQIQKFETEYEIDSKNDPTKSSHYGEQKNFPDRVKESLLSKNYQVKKRDSLKEGGEHTSKREVNKNLVTSASRKELTHQDNNYSVAGNLEQNAVETSKKNPFISELIPIGQVHSTYIIAQGEDGFFVIDQHVAHERIIFEELMTSFQHKGLPSQVLLIPITLELTVKEMHLIESNMELFERLGFEVEVFGKNTIILRSVPENIDERSDRELFLEVVDLLLEDKDVKDRSQIYRRLITTVACKSAIKAGEYLEHGEMVKLLQDLSKTENPLFCPHGRPIFFHISQYDLLKAFHRI